MNPSSNKPNTPMIHPAILIGLLATLTIGSFSYTFYTSWQLRKDIEQKNQQLITTLRTLEHSQIMAQAALQASQTNNQTTATTLHQALDELNNQLHTAINPSTDVSNHWLLLKAHYAIELAELNAYWSRDSYSTIALLKYADNLLAQHPSAQLFTVRQALAREITAQETAPTLDQAGVLSQLDALQQEITHCSFKQTPQPIVQNDKTSPTATASTSWHARMSACLHLLKQFFVVRYHPDPLQPLLTPAYKALQRETIRLNLQEAQWAVLQRNETVYQLSLKQAIRNIHRAFGNNTSTQPLLNQLHALTSIVIQSTKIIPDESLTALNQVMDAIASPHENTDTLLPEAGVTQP